MCCSKSRVLRTYLRFKRSQTYLSILDRDLSHANLCKDNYTCHHMCDFLIRRPSYNQKCQTLSRVHLFATPWTAACQALLSMGFSRQEYQGGYPSPSPGESSQPRSPTLQADPLPSEPPGKPFIQPTAAAAKPLQSCPTLCDPIDGSPPGSAVPEILQARALEWVAISFSILQPKHLLNRVPEDK